MAQIQINTLRVLSDNYCYLVRREGSTSALVIDPSEAAPVAEALRAAGSTLGLILNTHHHHDHIGGNANLSETFRAPVWCSSVDLERVPGAVRGLHGDEWFEFDGMCIQVLAIPGHTRGQIAFYFPDAHAVFVGDTLFAMGCGRLYEGTATELFASLAKLSRLPADTHIYFGHEYTTRNAAFAQSVEPGNRDIATRAAEAKTITPAPTLAEERRVNPFLRTDSLEIRRQLQLENASDLEVFTRLREMRNDF